MLVVCEPSVYSVMQLSSPRTPLVTSFSHNDAMHARRCGHIERVLSTAGLHLAASQLCSPTHAQAASQPQTEQLCTGCCTLKEKCTIYGLSWLQFLALSGLSLWRHVVCGCGCSGKLCFSILLPAGAMVPEVLSVTSSST